MSDETKSTSDIEKQGKPDYYKLAEEHPDKYRILESGAVYGKAEKKIVAMDASRNPYAITEENSLDYHRQRASLLVQSQAYARSGVAAHLDTPTALDAWADIVGTQAEQARDKGNRSTESARFVGIATGFMVERYASQSSDVPASGVQINVPVEALVELLNAANRLLEGQKGEVNGSGQVIEGDACDN
jgi:hypothetical protein